MKLYKLTDQAGYTRRGSYNETCWSEGSTHKATGRKPELCTDGVIHAYCHPLIAVLLNPIHADINNPLLWEAEGEIVVEKGDKCGCRELTTLKKIKLPTITTEQRVRFAIAIALTVYQETGFVTWAKNWLSGKDRTQDGAAQAAAEAGAAAATWAAGAAEWAAWEAAATWAAEWAAAAAGDQVDSLRLIQIAEWAVSDRPYEELEEDRTQGREREKQQAESN